MKNKLLLLLLIASLFACKPEEPIPDKHNYYYLTAEQLAKTPYFTNPAFDTLTYVSNQNDTVVFAKTRVDSGWYREIDFNPGVEFTTYHYYQQISANYQTIKGDGSFGVVHSKKLAGGLPDLIELEFNDYSFYIHDDFLGINHDAIIDSLTIDHFIFYQITKLNNDRVDSNSARAYINRDFGIFHVLDYKRNKIWTLN